MNSEIDALLPQVRQPSRYGGNELHVVKKAWDSVSLRMVLAFPDLYELGMSHQGLQILYHIVNAQKDMLAERVYTPDRDLEELLRAHRLPLFSLESQRPLADFDILGITLPYELCYTNILTILALAGLPFRSAERSAAHPLVIGGGPCAFHPEPVADFFDAILLGDGEEAVLEMAEAVRLGKENGEDRPALLERLSRIEGVYVPSFFAPEYDGNGNFLGMRTLSGTGQVRRRILADLEGASIEQPPLVPLTRIVHDRLGLEIARGCTRGCRFCQAGMIYRPVRERTPEKIFAMAEKGIAEGGFEELALLSLSTGDYSCLSELLVRLMNRFAKEHVSVSLPSLRVGTLTPAIMEQIKRVRKTGFTLAPEAGSDRLRRVINKGITEEDLLSTAEAAFGLGWKLIKLYFMFGLPTETEEDVAAIPALAQKVLKAGRGGNCRVNVSAATFVPKPHTVFEREPQLSMAEGYARMDAVKKRLYGKNCTMKRNDPRMSFLEGVFSRGDRRLSRLLEEAWQRGARMDAWSEHFDLTRWQEAAAACGLELEHYLRRREVDEPLPWQHLGVGVRDDFFAEEYGKALREEYTPDCRVHGCQQCGVCDLKTLKPVVHRCKHDDAVPDPAGAEAPPAESSSGKPILRPHFLYKLTYSRLNNARLLSHLELLQVFFRAFNRAKLPLNFSQGFNPTPKVSFSPALPLGTESLAEFVLIDLFEPLADLGAFVKEMNRQLPEGLFVSQAVLAGKEHAGTMLTTYHLRLARLPVQEELDRVMAQESLPVVVMRKGLERQLDLRPLLSGLRLTEEGQLELSLFNAPGQPGGKPVEVAAKLFALSEEEIRRARVVKIASEPYVVREN
ncbi:TIGR03960 family B12-binding radical SAM protein [Thiovibrio frasassiensis]|uniref:TIGR03960 family B12-binding radical SAM protein n=1 Tax=Thiovibrio frasassiensis TaxID=2984131 RepID=A0A9X4MJ77_9BACT|nr:TIGR03960 family B12-binding radical SAM protein [Thiovibrio frasassiensis]MDG4476995.1 TIGR03960 family B12-binding radical SAM protein [Thiovibrio frasassiensis]